MRRREHDTDEPADSRHRLDIHPIELDLQVETLFNGPEEIDEAHRIEHARADEIEVGVESGKVETQAARGLLDLFEIWNALSFSYSNIWVLRSSSSNILLLGL